MKKEYICEYCEYPCWLTVECDDDDGNMLGVPNACIYGNQEASWRDYE